MQHSERLIGRFGSRIGSQIWEVRWHESTGEVRALARSGSDSPTEEQLVLGVVPTHDHLVAALSARAAHSALELASLTSTLHIALADAYRVVHQRVDAPEVVEPH